MLNPMVLERVLEDEYCYDGYGAKLFRINRTELYNIGGLRVIKDPEANRYMFLPESHYDANQFRKNLIDYMSSDDYLKSGMKDIVDALAEGFRARYWCEWYNEEPEINPDEIMVLLNGVTEE